MDKRGAKMELVDSELSVIQYWLMRKRRVYSGIIDEERKIELDWERFHSPKPKVCIPLFKWKAIEEVFKDDAAF